MILELLLNKLGPTPHCIVKTRLVLYYPYRITYTAHITQTRPEKMAKARPPYCNMKYISKGHRTLVYIVLAELSRDLPH